MNDQQQAKRDLLRILKQWKADVNSETPPYDVRGTGLCTFVHALVFDAGSVLGLRLPRRGHSPGTPFNDNYESYVVEKNNFACHRNRKRRAWVDKTIIQLEQELSHDRHDR